LRDHEFDLDRYRRSIEGSLRSAIRVLLFFRRYFAERRPDLVYTFNGRFVESRPIVELCVAEGIPFRTYEVGGRANKYQIFENTLPHELRRFRERIEAFWSANQNDGEKETVAARWYTNRRHGVLHDAQQPVFTTSQNPLSLPVGFDRTKRNIAVFNSSEDEFAAVGDAASFPLYRDQNEALERTIERLLRVPGVHVYVRVHPNLAGVDCSQNRALPKFSAPNLTIVPAESPIGSYALMESCEQIVTFGSTIGAEATFWGKPSILFGRSAYENLGVAYEPQGYDELEAMIRTPGLAPQPRVAALKYGYWAAEAGEEVQHFQDMVNPDRFSGYDRCGVMYQHVMTGLFRIKYPVTHTPFYNRILDAVARRSRRDFYGSTT
jgi:hypothetical protein